MSVFVKTWFHTFDLVSFLLTFANFAQCSFAFIIDFVQVNTGWEG